MILGRPIVLILLPAAAAFVALSLRGRGYGKGKLLFLGLLRLLLASSAVLAAAQVSVLLPSPKRHVVFLIDESPSCAHRLASAERLVTDRIKRLDPDDVPVVFRFDRRVSVGELLTERGGGAGPVRTEERRLEPGTDISAALEAALAAIPTGHRGVVFLLSDGIETHGEAAKAALRLRSRGIPVYVPRPSAEPPTDVRVSALDAPSAVGRNHLFRVICRIEATRPLTAKVELTRDGRAVMSRTVELKRGIPAVVPVLDVLDDEGLHIYAARVSAVDDSFPRNNELKAPVFVRAPPLAVYLTGFAEEAPVERLLKGLKPFRFRRVSSGGELTAALLAEASVVVLDNFSADRLGAADRQLASFVRDAGGGLLMVGGPRSFGVGGYIDTAVDRVLPVHCDPRDAEKKPLALAVALDSSGSMGEGGGRKMETARTAAVRTLSRLGRKDAACVIAFRVTPEVIVPLGPVADMGAIVRRLARVAPVGGTNIFPALERALKELEGAKAPLRHVVILSDGKSRPGDAAGLIERCRSARVTLSAVATGRDADRVLLSGLAAGTGGRFYEATDVSQVPELFLDDLRRVDGPLVRKGNFGIEAGTPGEILKGIDLTELPAVNAYNRTRARKGATVLLKHTFENTPEPVLAVRRMGLGRAAALTLSFDRTWSGGFPRWREWGNVLVGVIRRVHRTEPIDDCELIVRRRGGAFAIRVVDNTRPASEKGRALAVRLTPLSGAAVEAPLERTGVRAYGGETETGLKGVVSAVLVEKSERGARHLASRYVPESYPREFRELTPRLDNLERIVRITVGRIVDNLDEFRAAGGTPVREKHDLTLWLVALVLALFVTELVGRALGVF